MFLTSAFIMLNASIPFSVKIISSLTALAIALPAPLRIVAGVFGILTGAIWAYNSAMAAAAATTTAATGGLNIVIGLLAGGIALLASGFTDFESSSLSLKSNIQQVSSSVSEYYDVIGKPNFVKELSESQTARNTRQENAYRQAIDELNARFPQIISGIDSKTGALRINASALDDVINKQKELAQIELSANIDESTDSFIQLSDTVFDNSSRLKELRKEEELYASIVESMNDYLKELNTTTDEGLSKAIDANLIREKNNKLLDETRNQIIGLEDSNKSAFNSASDLISQYLKFDRIYQLLFAVVNATDENSQAVQFLKMALSSMKAEGYAALNGINVGLIAHSDAFTAFAKAWNLFTQAVSSGNQAAMESALAEVNNALNNLRTEYSKIERKTETVAPRIRTGKREKEYEKVEKSEVLDPFKEELTYISRQIKLLELKNTLDKTSLNYYLAHLELSESLADNDEKKIEYLELEKEIKEKIKSIDEDESKRIKDDYDVIKKTLELKFEDTKYISNYNSKLTQLRNLLKEINELKKLHPEDERYYRTLQRDVSLEIAQTEKQKREKAREKIISSVAAGSAAGEDSCSSGL